MSAIKVKSKDGRYYDESRVSNHFSDGKNNHRRNDYYPSNQNNTKRFQEKKYNNIYKTDDPDLKREKNEESVRTIETCILNVLNTSVDRSVYDVKHIIMDKKIKSGSEVINVTVSKKLNNEDNNKVYGRKKIKYLAFVINLNEKTGFHHICILNGEPGKYSILFNVVDRHPNEKIEKYAPRIMESTCKSLN